MVKRAFDLLVALLLLLLLWPLLLVAAVCVRLDSPGPAFYRAVRIGRGGVPFRMWKFRTMVANADRLGGTSTGLHDARITRVGRWLRAAKLDELPQLFNVVRGEMSVVGPRPEVEEYTRLYAGEELLILSVRPGITDFASLEFSRLAEVLGSGDPDLVYAEQVRPIKNRLRLKYVREASFGTDLAILWRTALKALRGWR
ncbi:MAG: sugar transferase [Gemmatimonadales bacterium]